MRLIDHVGFDLAGRASLSTRDSQADALALTRIHGSGRAAARWLGVPETTFRGWRKGIAPKGEAADMLAQAARDNEVEEHDPAGFDEAVKGNTELVIRGVFTSSSDTRVRTIHPGRVIPRQTMARVLKTWRDGEDDKAERQLLRAIKDYYHDFDYDQVYWARFMEPGEQAG